MGLIDIILYAVVIIIGFVSGRFTGGTKELLLIISRILNGVIKDREELKREHPKVEKKLTKKKLLD